MTSRGDFHTDSGRVGTPGSDSEETPDLVTSTPAREVESMANPLVHPQVRPHVTIEDSMAAQAGSQPADAMVNLTQTINHLLQQFTSQVTRMNTRRERPTQCYSGLIHKDPEAFIQYMERYFADNNVIEEHQRIETFRNQLKDAARKWAQAFERIPLSYQAFKDSFLTAAISQLYGEKQRVGESVEVFITRKRSLFARLNLNVEEEVMTQVITDQLLPPIRSKLRGHKFRDIVELTHHAGKAEMDAADEAQYWKQLYTPVQYTQAPPPQRVHPPPVTRSHVRPPQQPSSGSSSQPPGSSSSLITRANLRPPRKENNQVPPSPCRFCQGWHFHKDCPRNPYRAPLNMIRVSEKSGDLSGSSAAQPQPQRQTTSALRNQPSHQIQVIADVHAEAEANPN